MPGENFKKLYGLPLGKLSAYAPNGNRLCRYQPLEINVIMTSKHSFLHECVAFKTCAHSKQEVTIFITFKIEKSVQYFYKTFFYFSDARRRKKLMKTNYLTSKCILFL